VTVSEFENVRTQLGSESRDLSAVRRYDPRHQLSRLPRASQADNEVFLTE